MIFTRIVLLVVALSTSAPGLSSEALTPEKEAVIRELLEITGAVELANQMSSAVLRSMLDGLRQRHPETSQRVVDVVVDETNLVTREWIARLQEEVIPLYHKYFTAEEIGEMIQFYSTPLGQKTIRVTPSLAQESMQAGQQWAQEMAPVLEQRILQRLADEGLDIGGSEP